MDRTLGCRMTRIAVLTLAVVFGLPSARLQVWSLDVSPVRVVLSQAYPTASLTVQNNSSEATVVQIEIMAWSQAAGQDVYTPSRDLLANPPIFTVSPKGTQIVRVGLRRSVDLQSELAYRFYLQEVPQPSKPGFQGLQMALRLGVPVFVPPQHRPLRSCAGRRDVTTQAFWHSLSPISVPGSEQVVATQPVSAYVLPGQTRQWSIHPQPAWQGKRLHILAHTPQSELSADVEVELLE